MGLFVAIRVCTWIRQVNHGDEIANFPVVVDVADDAPRSVSEFLLPGDAIISVNGSSCWVESAYASKSNSQLRRVCAAMSTPTARQLVVVSSNLSRADESVARHLDDEGLDTGKLQHPSTGEWYRPDSAVLL